MPILNSLPRVVFIGHVCIDHNRSEHASYISWGSPALYMAEYLKRKHGIEPSVITNYGKDILRYAGHFELLPAVPPVGSSMVYENVTSEDGRTQRCYRNDAAEPPELDAALIDTIGQADILVIAPLTPDYSATYIRQLLQYARKHCLVVCCPQGYFRDIDDDGVVSPRLFDEAESIVSQCNLVVLSEEDHPTATAQAQEWYKAAPDCCIVVTHGSRGASIVVADGLKLIPTEPVSEEDVVDSVGCGDVFTAGTMLGMYGHYDIVQAVKDGHAAARDKLLSVNQDAVSS